MMGFSNHRLAALRAVVDAARDWHEEYCGCSGEACEVGRALESLRLLEAAQRGAAVR